MNFDTILSFFKGLGGTRLIQSSKAWVVCTAIVGVMVAEYLGKIPMTQAIDTVKWLVAAFVGATALEDAAAKVNAPALPTKADVVVSATDPGAAK